MKFDTMVVNYTISNAPKGEKSIDIECTLEQFLAHEGVAIVNYQQLGGINPPLNHFGPLIGAFWV